MGELYTRLFVNPPTPTCASPDDDAHRRLLGAVATQCGGGTPVGWILEVGPYEVETRPNDARLDTRVAPGDFIGFPFTVEVVAGAEAVDRPAYVAFVARLMRGLHALGMQVVAACDWERELPGGGRLGVGHDAAPAVREDGPGAALDALLDAIARRVDCRVFPPRGRPPLRPGDALPEDLAAFYDLCGGVLLHVRSGAPIRVVGPHELLRSNPEIVGQECPGDITDAWYIVARAGDEAAVSIDCGRERLGRCYDSFWDCHGVAGSCPIVARSFTELLRRLFECGSDYWVAADAPAYGDAYDDR